MSASFAGGVSKYMVLYWHFLPEIGVQILTANGKYALGKLSNTADQ
jgi:hypothetical protein